MTQANFKLSLERDHDGRIIEVFFDDQHEPATYEELNGNQDFRLIKGTEFQQKVWLELLKIPTGTSITYQEMAKRVGSPQAQQAVGQALSKNPLPVILPCHRVTQKNGKLGGFMGKEARQDIKQAILDYERQDTLF